MVYISMPTEFYNVCILISSSDNTWDVARQTLYSFLTYWPNCPFPIFVGLNSPNQELIEINYHPVFAEVSGWRQELHAQVASLPEQYGYILLFLDDFVLLSPVDEKKLLQLVNEALSNEWAYLRFKQLLGAWLPLLARRIKDKIKNQLYCEIPQNAPYFSSLQVALWERAHLLNMLNLPGSIWDFERQAIPNVQHYAICCKSPIDYIHVVERGQWQPYAKRVLSQCGVKFDPGSRIVRGIGSEINRLIYKIKFALFGYTGYRLRQWHKADILNTLFSGLKIRC